MQNLIGVFWLVVVACGSPLVGPGPTGHQERSGHKGRHSRQLQQQHSSYPIPYPFPQQYSVVPNYPGVPSYPGYTGLPNGAPMIYSGPQAPVIYQIFLGGPPPQQQTQQCTCPASSSSSSSTSSSTESSTTVSPFIDDRFGEDKDKPDSPPSKCVWSIVACCAPGSEKIRYSCFELLGCHGAFWGDNPCKDKVVMAAASTALKYYESNSIET